MRTDLQFLRVRIDRSAPDSVPVIVEGSTEVTHFPMRQMFDFVFRHVVQKLHTDRQTDRQTHPTITSRTTQSPGE